MSANTNEVSDLIFFFSVLCFVTDFPEPGLKKKKMEIVKIIKRIITKLEIYPPSHKLRK